MKQLMKEEKGFQGKMLIWISDDGVIGVNDWVGIFCWVVELEGWKCSHAPLSAQPCLPAIEARPSWLSSEAGVFRAIFSWVRECRRFLSISRDHAHFHQQKFPGNSLNYQTYTRESEIRYNMSMSYLLTYGRWATWTYPSFQLKLF